MNVQYGYARDVSKEWCVVDPRVEGRMLCGRRRGFVPVVQPAFAPGSLHPACREALWGRGSGRAVEVEPDVFATGVCPECGGTVPVDGAVVAAHGQVVVRGWAEIVTGTPCDGQGKPSEEHR